MKVKQMHYNGNNGKIPKEGFNFIYLSVILT